jgi:hypothetical protein
LILKDKITEMAVPINAGMAMGISGIRSLNALVK